MGKHTQIRIPNKELIHGGQTDASREAGIIFLGEKMEQVRVSVQVVNPSNPRAGQAGQTWGLGSDAQHVAVCFDVDGQVVDTPIADLKYL